MDRPRGFSLLELIVVTAIAAILAAIATQSYTRHAFRSRRADAHQLLMSIAQAQERWYATHNRYADELEDLGYTIPARSQHGYYEATLSLQDDTGQGFVASAVPMRQQAGDACGTLSIDDAGRKLPDEGETQANANGRCW